jgi:GPH family glycoside/pentoside/hexuronide:cation symporter
MADAPTAVRKAPLRDIFAYATGDGANSLIMNTFYSFAMLYITKALGLSGTRAGLAMSLTLLWDAVTDPVMGHMSDSTRSRFGRRHPYMLVGGILAVLFFYAIWAVPASLQTPEAIFWYIVTMNVLLRTASTVFGVPYGALGFEICTDYDQRTTLQSIRGGLNMAMNLLGPAILGWSVFLRDRDGVSGVSVRSNFQEMGLAFSVIALAFLLYMVFATRKYAVDSRHLPNVAGSNLRQILRGLTEVLFNPHALIVYAFIVIMFVGVVLVTSLQLFIYLDFMKFSPWQKTVVHGGTMISAGIGSLLAAPMVRRFDKKGATYRFLLLACFGNVMLVLLFGTGWISPAYTWSVIPVAMVVFGLFHVCYHMGATAANTIANSMMADISEINWHRTGTLRDGTYSAMLTFFLKLSISGGLLLCGIMLDMLGVKGDAGQQAPEVARNMVYAAFVGGTVITLLAAGVIMLYPVDKAYVAQIRSAMAAKMPPCRHCQYDLTGNTSGVCPGCGTPIAGEDSQT